MCMKKKFFLLSFILLCPLFLSAHEYSDAVYSSIEDIYHPTFEDYQKVENYLNFGYRPHLVDIDHNHYSTKSKIFRLTPAENSNHKLTYRIEAVNCSEDTKENCIILYASCNSKYPESLLTLVEEIKKSDFIGHIVYRIGGWPNAEGGDLTLAHIPYSFKVCAFKEAYRLGYKRALWLDASMRPYASLNDRFLFMKKHGCFNYYSRRTLSQLCTKDNHLANLEITEKKARRMYTVCMGVFGIDFTNPTGLSLLSRWYDQTKNNEAASFTTWVETNLVSLIVNQLYPHFPFPRSKRHLFCTQHYKPGREPNYSTLHFSYNKLDVEPDWPNYD